MQPHLKMLDILKVFRLKPISPTNPLTSLNNVEQMIILESVKANLRYLTIKLHLPVRFVSNTDRRGFTRRKNSTDSIEVYQYFLFN